MIATEYVLSDTPFVIRRRVKWGDCDPAGVVYTVTFSEYVISAAELFYGRILGGTPQRLKDEHGFGTPTRALSFDFQASLWPDEEFDMTVRVERIGERSYTLHIAGSARGRPAFDARLSPICVARGARPALPIPAAMRDALLAYQAACAQAAPTQEP
jgi:acyl-CoA thioester hydrolase